jgi:hypothetical protein
MVTLTIVLEFGLWFCLSENDRMVISLGGGGDAYFGLPLWLTTDCRGHVLWAYNIAHLDLLEAFVSAQLRERGPILGSMSLVERLHAWIKDAKNRDDVIRAIHRLRRSRGGPRRPAIRLYGCGARMARRIILDIVGGLAPARIRV